MWARFMTALLLLCVAACAPQAEQGKLPSVAVPSEPETLSEPRSVKKPRSGVSSFPGRYEFYQCRDLAFNIRRQSGYVDFYLGDKRYKLILRDDSYSNKQIRLSFQGTATRLWVAGREYKQCRSL